MQAEELIQLVHKIRHYQCEFQNIELKAAAGGCPTRLYDTLSSFSNQSGGGIIIFGIDEKQGFKVVGVYDIQNLQQKVTEQCKQMEPEVRPLFTPCEIDGKFVVSAEIPEVDVSKRPVYYKGAGRHRGSFVRVGDADEPMNEYEIYTYDAFRRRLHDDTRIIENAKLSQLRADELQTYIDAVKKNSPNHTRSSTDNEILELMGITSDGQPTLSGVLIFGNYPQAYFPQLSITAVSVPGTEMGDVGADEERFIDNKRINGTISEMLEGAVDFIKRNSRVKTIIDDNGKRHDKPEYPMKAIREVILNALIHRDYSIHTEGSPITICMFRDRIEIVNKGGLYGRITVDQLGKVITDTRNPILANILEVLHVTENRFSGIPTIRAEMAAANLPEPEFVVQRGEFKVILRNNLNVYTEAPRKASIKTADRVMELINYCSTPRSRDELTEFLGFSKYYTMSKIVQPLVEQGEIKLTMPDKPKSSKQRYVKA